MENKTAEILDVLGRMSMIFPQLRFGQLVLNAITASELYYMSDEQVLQCFEQYLKRYG